MASAPHTAVKRELLVRYLDFWTPAALGSSRPATYLDTTTFGPAAAVRVFAEFADLLAGRELSMLVAGSRPADPGVAGLRITAPPPDLAGELGPGPVLAHLAGDVDPAVAAAVARGRAGELLQVTAPAGPSESPSGLPPAGSPPQDPRPVLYAAGFTHVVAVELVDDAGRAELLRFATSSDRSLERFKDELWAVDQFAGIRYRDPAEPDALPLDISFEPHPGPLRRSLLEHLATGDARTVNELRAYALTRTVYRPADVSRALAPLIARGALTRDPERGRLTGTTTVRLAGATGA
jgi:hypothetical protein